MKSIDIRFHHLICIPRYYSGGYDRVFSENMMKVCHYLRENPLTKIKLTIEKPDVLCRKCPYVKNNHCTQGRNMAKFVELLDYKVAKYLKLKPNSVHIAKDAFNLAMQKINDNNFEKFCNGCAYVKNCSKIKINNSFAKDLNKN